MSEFLKSILAVWAGLPLALTALATLVAGWLAAHLARFLLTRILAALKLQKLFDTLGVTEFLRKGGVTYSVIQLAGVLVYWLVLAATFLLISASLDIAVVNSLWGKIVGLIPGILAALLVTAIGAITVTFFANFALTIARNAALPNAELVAKGIKYAGIVLVLLIALDQVGVAGNTLRYLLLIAFAALCLGLALAFGLGCKDLARSSMERFLRNLRERGRSGHPTDLEG